MNADQYWSVGENFAILAGYLGLVPDQSFFLSDSKTPNELTDPSSTAAKDFITGWFGIIRFPD